MLKLRILTGVPLAVAAVWFLLTQSSDSVAIALVIIAFIAGWEWAGLSVLVKPICKLISGLVLAALVYVVSLLSNDFYLAISMLAIIVWSFIIYHLSQVKSISPISSPSFKTWLLSIPVILPAMLAMLAVHREYGGEWLLFGMSLVWVADTGAYFAGRKFGKNKLAVVLSPGKTREGFYGALITTLVYALIVSLFYFNFDVDKIIKVLLITLVLNVYSVTGDLLESLLKRRAGVKDSGKILPGHGGVLDRIDSLTATSSLFLLGSMWVYSFKIPGL